MPPCPLQADASGDESVISVIARLRLKAGGAEYFEDGYRRYMDKVREHEPGTLAFTLFKSIDEQDTYWAVEEYRDQAAVDVRMAQPYRKDIRDKLDALIESAEVHKVDGVLRK